MGLSTRVYRDVVELLEWMPGEWRMCEVVSLDRTGLGYVWHGVCEGFVLYHLVSGVNLGVVAETEEAARMVVQGIAGMADWWLDTEELLRRFPAEALQQRVDTYVDTLIAQGYVLERTADDLGNDGSVSASVAYDYR